MVIWGISSLIFFSSLFCVLLLKSKEFFLVYYCLCFSWVFNWRSHNVFAYCSDIYPILERVCLEGSRMQAKIAVAAIAALAGVSEQFFFSELCKVYLSQYFGATSDI
jgi:hypothetical protein